jgi:ribosomal-protein-alanine N-acetyltransferase
MAPKTIEDLKEFVTITNDSEKELLVGIFLRDSKSQIGNIKLGPISRHHNRADLGFIIGEQSAWGKGYATEAICALTNYALTVLKLDKVSAGCYARNRGSARALEKAGFHLEGCLRGHWEVDGEREDGFVYGIVANVHKEVKG